MHNAVQKDTKDTSEAGMHLLQLLECPELQLAKKRLALQAAAGREAVGRSPGATPSPPAPAHPPAPPISWPPTAQSHSTCTHTSLFTPTF